MKRVERVAGLGLGVCGADHLRPGVRAEPGLGLQLARAAALRPALPFRRGRQRRRPDPRPPSPRAAHGKEERDGRGEGSCAAHHVVQTLLQSVHEECCAALKHSLPLTPTDMGCGVQMPSFPRNRKMDCGVRSLPGSRRGPTCSRGCRTTRSRSRCCCTTRTSPARRSLRTSAAASLLGSGCLQLLQATTKTRDRRRDTKRVRHCETASGQQTAQTFY